MITITFISDTHGLHDQLTDKLTEPTDFIIHAGDISSRGSSEELKKFFKWYNSLEGYKHKIFIAGNHDFFFEQYPRDLINQLLKPYPDIIYLQDESVTLEGLKIYGSPYQPEFFDWAFNLKRGEQLAQKWSEIPEDTDLLITHGPPHKILDEVLSGEKVGCEALIDRVLKVNPLFHVFGHIHEAYGIKTFHDINFINASSVNRRYQVVNDPIIAQLIDTGENKIINFN